MKAVLIFVGMVIVIVVYIVAVAAAIIYGDISVW